MLQSYVAQCFEIKTCVIIKKIKEKGKINIENKMLSLLNVAADKMETKKKTLSSSRVGFLANKK